MSRFLAAILLALCLMTAAKPLYATVQPGLGMPPGQPSNDHVLARIAEIQNSMESQRSSFNAADDGWDSDADEDVQRSFGPGVYQIRVDATNTVAWGNGPVTAHDFYAEVDAYHVAGPLDNEFGILFRNDGNNYYLFNVSSDGYFRLHKWLDGEWASIVDWQESSAIATGEGSHNRLAVLADGPAISVLANDIVLATVTDDTIRGDGLALAAGTFDDGGVEIAFDDFTLWQLAQEPVPAATPTQPATPEPVTSTGETLSLELVGELIDPIRENAPDYSDDFRRASDRWPTVDGENGSIAFAQRGLKIKIDTPNQALWTSGQEIAALNPAGLLIEADSARSSGPYNGTYGLLVRFVDNDNFYYFGISGAGTYSFWRVVAGEWTNLVDWTASDAIKTQDRANNRLAVLAQGDRMLLLANDVPLTYVTDNTFAAGGVGVYAGVYDEAGLDVIFDNMDVWVLSEAEAAVPVDRAAIDAAQTQSDAVGSRPATYADRFARDEGTWSLGDDSAAEIAIKRGNLAIDVAEKQWLAWAANEMQVGDLQMEVDVSLADDKTPAEAGVMFRMQDENNFYFVAIDNTGRYSLWKKQDGEWLAVSPWAMSDLLETGAGARNRIGVLADGARLAVLVNGQAVAAVEDNSFGSGTVALAVGTFAQPGAGATFDNLELWDLAAE